MRGPVSQDLRQKLVISFLCVSPRDAISPFILGLLCVFSCLAMLSDPGGQDALLIHFCILHRVS